LNGPIIRPSTAGESGLLGPRHDAGHHAVEQGALLTGQHRGIGQREPSAQGVGGGLGGHDRTAVEIK
jgi:hypothetical protein